MIFRYTCHHHILLQSLGNICILWHNIYNLEMLITSPYDKTQMTMHSEIDGLAHAPCSPPSYNIIMSGIACYPRMKNYQSIEMFLAIYMMVTFTRCMNAPGPDRTLVLLSRTIEKDMVELYSNLNSYAHGMVARSFVPAPEWAWTAIPTNGILLNHHI